jgi:O-acetyl-ADP-ribose deacetylase
VPWRSTQANGLGSIAFPAISTGVYRFPADRAVGIAIFSTARALVAVPAATRVVFRCFFG